MIPKLSVPRPGCPALPYCPRLVFGPLAADVSRLALDKKLEELLALEAVLPEKAMLAQDEKDAAVAEARRRGALPNPLTRYAGKVGSCLGRPCSWVVVFLSLFFFPRPS